MKKVGVVRFLGTNCDQDVFDAIKSLGAEASWLWYQDHFNVEDYDSLIIPGGFSYGDYLRCGALAAKSAVMDSVEDFSKKGKPVLGICNGFQVLCERGLLPGALLRNQNLKFKDEWVDLKPQTQGSFWSLAKGIRVPIAHGEGRYYNNKKGLKELQDKEQIWLQYQTNPNGSLLDIAGVVNQEKNVAGLMPHPERAIFNWMGGAEGRLILEKLVQ